MGPNNYFQTQPVYPQYFGNNQSFQSQPQTQMSSPLNQTSSINWVIGRAGADAHPVVPGNEVALFDSTAPVVYLKKIGLDGKPEYLKTYDMVLREEREDKPEKIDLSAYITRDEIADLISSAAKAEVDRAISEISLKPSKKKRGDDE